MTRLSATEATSHAEVLTLSTGEPPLSPRPPPPLLAESRFDRAIEMMINGPTTPTTVATVLQLPAAHSLSTRRRINGEFRCFIVFETIFSFKGEEDRSSTIFIKIFLVERIRKKKAIGNYLIISRLRFL